MLRKLKSLIALAAIASSHAALPDAATNPALDDITPAVGGGAYRQITIDGYKLRYNSHPSYSNPLLK